MYSRNYLKLLTLIALFTFLFSCTTENNWPQFRGPDFNLAADNENLPTEWSDSTNVIWALDLDGESWSSPIVINNRVFFTTCKLIEKAPEVVAVEGENEQQNENDSYLNDVYKWEIVCVDLNSGEEIWRKTSFEGNPKIKKHPSTNYAAETPVSDGSKIYVYYGMVGVYCYNLDGELLWQQDLGAYETKNGWGTGSSPVVYGGKLYVQVDNEERSFVVALDTETGKEIWKVERNEKTNYATPVIWENSERAELVLMGVTCRSYNPENGELLWQIKLGGEQSIQSPVFNSNYIYLGIVPGRNETPKFYCVKAGANGDITPATVENYSEWIAWVDTTINIGNPSPVLYQDKIYVLSSRGGELACLDAETGEKFYQEKINGVGASWASPWANNGRIYFYDERGNTQMVKAGETFEVIGSNELSGKFWSSVAITNNAYLIRGIEKLYCIGKS